MISLRTLGTSEKKKRAKKPATPPKAPRVIPLRYLLVKLVFSSPELHNKIPCFAVIDEQLWCERLFFHRFAHHLRHMVPAIISTGTNTSLVVYETSNVQSRKVLNGPSTNVQRNLVSIFSSAIYSPRPNLRMSLTLGRI